MVVFGVAIGVNSAQLGVGARLVSTVSRVAVRRTTSTWVVGNYIVETGGSLTRLATSHEFAFPAYGKVEFKISL